MVASTKSMTKRVSAVVAVTAAMATLLAGCGGSSSSSSSKADTEPAAGYDTSYNGTYKMPDKYGDYSNPQPRSNIKDGGTLTESSTYTANWNQFSTDGNTTYMADMWALYQPSLNGFDVKGNLHWNKNYITKVTVRSKNPLTIVYDINPKATWNDGDPINWEDFRATWEVQNGKNPQYNPPATDGYDQIKSVTRGKDDKEAVVTFSKPYYPWQSIFGGLYNRKATDPKTFTQGWVDQPHNEWGAGPFIVQSQNKDGATFVRNPKWWGQPAKLSKIVMRYMESTATLNAFQNGELDVAGCGTGAALKQCRSRKDAQIRFGYSKNTDVLELNGKSGALKNINVRKGIIQSLNLKELQRISNQGLTWNAELPGSEVFTPFQAGYQNNVPKDAAYNPANARKSFEAAGYKKGSDGYYQKNGKDLTVRYTYFSDTATANAVARAYQQMLKTTGVKLTLDNRSSSKFSDTLTSGDFDLLPMAWSATSPYGQTSLNQLYAAKSPSNFTFVGSAAVDKLLDVPGTIENTTKSFAAANRAEKAALALYGTIPTDTPPSYTAVKKGLANVGPKGWRTVNPEDIGWQK